MWPGELGLYSDSLWAGRSGDRITVGARFFGRSGDKIPVGGKDFPDGPGIVSRGGAGGGEIFRTRPDRPWGPHSLLYNGYRVFPRGKAAGAWR